MNLFISYNGADAMFATRLADDLRRIGHQVWFDKTSIHSGDQILQRVSQGLDGADAVLLALSRASREAPFVRIEWLTALWDSLQQREVTILPLLLDDVDIPALLRGRRWADFRRHYIIGWTHLVTALDQEDFSGGLPIYRSDVVDMADDWRKLFTSSKCLDLVIMYGATWRNTFRKHLIRLANEGTLRTVLPEPRLDSSVIHVYAARLGCTPTRVVELIGAAIQDFSSLGPDAEIYLTDVTFTHSLYLFDTGAILSLYALCCERIPTPAFVFSSGSFTSFARLDLERLIATRARRIE